MTELMFLMSTKGSVQPDGAPCTDHEDYHLRVSGFWVENGVHDAGDALSGFDGARFSTKARSYVGSHCFESGRDNPGW